MSGQLPEGNKRLVTYQSLGSTRATALEWLGEQVGLSEGGSGGCVGFSAGKDPGQAECVSLAGFFFTPALRNRMAKQ